MSKRSPASLEVKLHGTVKGSIRKYKADGLEALRKSNAWKSVGSVTETGYCYGTI